jgi:hypothetical protein
MQISSHVQGKAARRSEAELKSVKQNRGLEVGGFSPDLQKEINRAVGVRRTCHACCARGGCRKSIPEWTWDLMVAAYAQRVKR